MSGTEMYESGECERRNDKNAHGSGRKEKRNKKRQREKRERRVGRGSNSTQERKK
jgi:hypothetical protein